MDSRCHLIERVSGNYVGMGGIRPISEDKVAVRGLMKPMGYTETGLRLSDGSTLGTNGVI